MIVGSGPNGLAAAITIAKQGYRVLMMEGKDTIGGGVRSAQLTLPGFTHDVCSTVHPLALSSPFFRSLDLESHRLKWVFSPYALAHPLDGGEAVLISRDLEETCSRLGPDGRTYRRIFAPLVARYDRLIADLLSPLRIPASPLLLARFGLSALRSAVEFANSSFSETGTRAVFAGMAAHGMLSIDRPGTASFGLVLALTRMLSDGLWRWAARKSSWRPWLSVCGNWAARSSPGIG